MIATPPDIHPSGRYNISEAARALGCSRTTIHAAINSHKIPLNLRKSTGRAYILGKYLIKFWMS